MKKITEMKNLKKTAAALTAAVLMTSAASAQVVYEQDFNNVTQYDLFGSNFNYTSGDANYIKFLFPGETVENEDGTTTLNPIDYGTPQLSIDPELIEVANEEALNFFSIENGKGVITKIGQRESYNRYGFKKSLADEIAAFNSEETGNETTEETTTPEETTEETTVDSVIKSGVWNFDFTLQSMQGGRRFLVLRNGDTEKMAVNIHKWPEKSGIAGTINDATAESNLIKYDRIDNTTANFGFALAWDNGVANFLRFQIDFDKNTLKIYRNTRTMENPNWKLVTRIPVKDDDGNITGYDDESGIALADFGVDLSEGIDSFGYEEIFHGNPCRMMIDDIKITRVSDGKDLYSCSFDDTTPDEEGNVKDSWWDYGFESTSQKSTIWLEDGKLNYKTDIYRDFIIDKDLGETANSGVWAVTVKYYSADDAGNGLAPAKVSGDTRSFINFLNDTYNRYGKNGNGMIKNSALGIGCNNSHLTHIWQITSVNGEVKNEYINSNLRKPANNGIMTINYLNGAEYKAVIDFTGEKNKLYMYAKLDYNLGNWVLMNPDGYTLPDDFNFNKVRLYDYNPGNRDWAAWDYFKIEKFDSVNDIMLTTDNDSGYIGKGESVNIGIQSFRAPSEESKTSFIDKSKVNVAAAVYDGGKLVDLKLVSNDQYSVFEEFNADVTFDTLGNNNDIKIFAVDPSSLRPLSNIKTLTGVAFD